MCAIDLFPTIRCQNQFPKVIGHFKSLCMGGQEKKRGVSDFGLYPLVQREFPKAESGKSFVSSPTSKDLSLLYLVAKKELHGLQWPSGAPLVIGGRFCLLKNDPSNCR